MEALEKGERTPAEELGVKDLDEAKRLIDAGRKEHNRSGYLERRMEELEEKLEDRREDEEEERFSDPGVKKISQEMRQLRKMVSGLVRQNDPEISKLEPYFGEVRKDHPGLWDLKDGPTRLAAVRSLAAQLYSKDHPDEGKSPPKEESTVDPRVHRQVGGASVMTAGGSEPDEGKLAKLLADAKGDAEKADIMDAWSRKYHPDEMIGV